MIDKEFAPAKVNLFLDVICKRKDNYHDLGTLFQTIDAGDTVNAEFMRDGCITLSYNKPQSYPVESDLVYKAALLLKKETNCNFGANIYLEKIMPLGAGLGGGSADAAATLRLLNRLWKLNLSLEQLQNMSVSLGADVPFLVRGGTAFAEGIGEKLTFLPTLKLPKNMQLLVATPLDSVPTKDAYAGVIKSGAKRWNDYKEGFLKNSENAIDFVLKNMFNDFESSVFAKHKLVESLKSEFMRVGSIATLMSGSGASVFGVFETAKKAENALQKLKNVCRYQKIATFFEKF